MSATETTGAPAVAGRARRRIGVGVIGFGWLGQAHSRSLLRIPTLFPEREFDAELVVCGDTLPERRDDAVRSFGFARAEADWRAVIDDPGVEVVFIAAPNMLHVELVEAAAQAGKHVFCEKPVGGTPEQTVRAAKAARGVTTDLMSHSVDLAHMLLGPIARVTGTTETFIRERPLPGAGGTHYGRGREGDPTGKVTNEDYAGMLCEFANGARGTFEASRSIVGPESQMAFEVYGTKGALGWNLEKLNELQVYLVEDELHTGYRTVFGGDRFPYHGHFVPGSANGIGFEDLVVIEDYEFCRSLAEGREHVPGFAEALEWVGVQAALLKSAESGHWEAVESLRED